MRFYAVILGVFCAFYTLYGAENLVRDFSLHKLNANDKRAPTLLLMGGIHGDEPGAYYASDFFIQHYRITKGSVWVVPVVNPHGMFANMRGMYGDMNRKFAALSQNDPDYESIQKIKHLLNDSDIDISLHLHDGSGYWRPTYINALLNPARWGNCSVIDQIELSGHKYGSLEWFVTQMVADINAHILKPIHRYHVHNTHTQAKNDKEQLRALTFFSLSLGKPALTNEASKELDIPTRVFYHLLAIESLMGQLGIGFERDFELSVANLRSLLSPSHLQVKIENVITLPLDSIRPVMYYFPLPKDTQPKHIKVQSDSQLFGLVANAKGYMELKFGSRTLSTLVPQWFAFDTSLKSVRVKVDDIWQDVALGSVIYAKEHIEFEPLHTHRINVIGYVLPNDNAKLPNESGVRIYKKDFIPRYSIDTQANIYRAEVYRGALFSGMITISFAPPPLQKEQHYHVVSYTPATHSPLAQKLALAEKNEIKKPQIKDSKHIESTLESTQKKEPTTTSTTSLPNAQTPIKEKKEKAKDVPSAKLTQDSKLAKDSISSKSNQSAHSSDITKTTQNIESTASPIRKNVFVHAERGVNVRAKPNTQSYIMAKLPQYAQLELLSQEGKWSKIRYGGNKDGYVITSALTDTKPIKDKIDKIDSMHTMQEPTALSQTLESTESTQPKTHQAPKQDIKSKTKARVIVNAALIRARPALDAPVVAKAPLGREMEILSFEGEDEQWAKIHYIFVGTGGSREINGYIARRLLKAL